jgi:predicted RNase H-like nuclease (RuvC/YqgF family)
MKRRHDSHDDGLPETDENGTELHHEVKRLRREVEEKDRRLEELERIVAGLQQAIPQQSPTEPDLQSLSQPTPQAAPPV